MLNKMVAADLLAGPNRAGEMASGFTRASPSCPAPLPPLPSLWSSPIINGSSAEADMLQIGVIAQDYLEVQRCVPKEITVITSPSEQVT